MAIKRVKMTPEMAYELVKNQITNRNIRRRHVERIKADIVEGRYDEDVCNPIRVNSAGVLTDGQHRLTAVVECGIAIWVWLETTDSDKIDMNIGRSAADILTMRGQHYTRTKEAVTRYVMMIEAMRAGGNKWGSSAKKVQNISRSAIVDRFSADPSLDEACEIGIAAYSEQPRFNRVFAASCSGTIAYFCHADIDDIGFARTNLAVIATGEGLHRGDPRLAYRQFVMSVGIREKQLVEVAAMFYCFRSLLSGRSVSLIRSSSIGDVSRLVASERAVRTNEVAHA